MKTSLNGNLILKPYTGTKELKTTQAATGFTMTANKVGIESLELLVDTSVFLGDNNKVLKKGTKIYFKEEILHTQAWSRKIYESKEFKDGFVIGHIKDILFLDEQEG